MAFEGSQILGNMNFGGGFDMSKLDLSGLKASMEQQRLETERKQKLQQEQATGIEKSAQLSQEQQAQMLGLKQKSEGANLMSAQLADKQKRETEQRMNTLALMQGYNPSAMRAATRGTAQAQQIIGQNALAAAEQEKSAALADYNQMLQTQQQMAFAGEQAKKNLLMGNQELQQQDEASIRNYQAALNEIDFRRRAAEKQREQALTSALLSGVATVGATVATGGNVAAGMAAGAATGALYNRYG